MGCANSKDSGVALRAGLVGCARTGFAVSPLTGSIPDAREPRANAPLRVERGGRGPAGRHGKIRGNEVDPAPRRQWGDGDEQREVVAGSSAGGPRSIFGRRCLQRTATGSSTEALRLLFSAFAVYASRWVVAPLPSSGAAAGNVRTPVTAATRPETAHLTTVQDCKLSFLL